jgi:hypothetical protein
MNFASIIILRFLLLNLYKNHDLVEITTIKETGFIISQLPQLEKWRHLHYEMNINLKGIEIIFHLLQQINNMQDQIQELKTSLCLYELILKNKVLHNASIFHYSKL